MRLHEREAFIREAEKVLEAEIAQTLERFPEYRYRGYHFKKRQQVKQVLIFTYKNQNFIIMGQQTLQVGNQAPILEALVDAGTLLPIPGATKVAKSKTFDTPAVATVDANGNLVAVAVGTGNLTDVNTWTYVDQDTGDTVTSDETTVLAIAIVATPEGVLQVVTLGPAVAIPAPAAAPAANAAAAN